MNAFTHLISTKIESYIHFRRSFGRACESQASTLRAFARFVTEHGDRGPLTQELALAFVLSCDVTPNVRARRFGVLRNFADYLVSARFMSCVAHSSMRRSAVQTLGRSRFHNTSFGTAWRCGSYSRVLVS